MSVTLTVLKPLTSRLVRLEQSLNMASIFVTLSVLRLLIPVIVVRFSQKKNQNAVLVIVEQFEKEESNTT